MFLLRFVASVLDSFVLKRTVHTQYREVPRHLFNKHVERAICQQGIIYHIYSTEKFLNIPFMLYVQVLFFSTKLSVPSKLCD